MLVETNEALQLFIRFSTATVLNQETEHEQEILTPTLTYAHGKQGYGIGFRFNGLDH